MHKMHPYLLLMALGILPHCNSYDSFESMAAEMCEGQVPDLVLSECPTPAQRIDVRSQAEWKVSHLHKAIHVEWDGATLSEMPVLDRDRPILVYCSVGYRSEQAGEYLLRQGYRQVYNLYGGLFKVYNEDPSQLTFGETPQIHGYNKHWSKWITRGGVVYE